MQRAANDPEHNRRGLPVLDVLVLGLMLVDAVLAVHDYANALHLDINPNNVLLKRQSSGKGVGKDVQNTSGSEGGESAPGKMSALLCDFGLMHKLASRVQVHGLSFAFSR